MVDAGFQRNVMFPPSQRWNIVFSMMCPCALHPRVLHLTQV